MSFVQMDGVTSSIVLKSIANLSDFCNCKDEASKVSH